MVYRWGSLWISPKGNKTQNSVKLKHLIQYFIEQGGVNVDKKSGNEDLGIYKNPIPNHGKEKDSKNPSISNCLNHTLDSVVGHIHVVHSSQVEKSDKHQDTFLVKNQDQSTMSSDVSYRNGIKYILDYNIHASYEFMIGHIEEVPM